MNEPFVKIDLHGMTQDQAMKTIDKAIASAGPAVYHLQCIHGYNRGTSLRTMIQDWYQYEPKVKRIMLADSLMDDISLFIEQNTEAEILDEEREMR